MLNELLAACGAFVFVYVLRLHYTFKILNRKPFACEVCMGGWFALVLNLNTYWLYIPFKMCLAMVLTILLTAILKRI
jgi:hypothetical protein